MTSSKKASYRNSRQSRHGQHYKFLYLTRQLAASRALPVASHPACFCAPSSVAPHHTGAHTLLIADMFLASEMRVPSRSLARHVRTPSFMMFGDYGACRGSSMKSNTPRLFVTKYSILYKTPRLCIKSPSLQRSTLYPVPNLIKVYLLAASQALLQRTTNSHSIHGR